MALEPASAPAIVWGATGDEAAAQSQAWMLATPLGTTPLSRAVGIDYSVIGSANNLGRPLLSAEIASAYVAQFPDVQLVSIEYVVGTDAASLQPSIVSRPK